MATYQKCGKIDHSFLQALAQRKVVTEVEALELMDAISSGLDGKFAKYERNKSAKDELRDTLAAMNGRLACMDLQLRGYYAGQRADDPDKPLVLIGLINLVSDDVAKMEGTRFKPEEVDAFKRVLAALADGPAAADALKAQRGKLKQDAFDGLLGDLVEQKWLAAAAGEAAPADDEEEDEEERPRKKPKTRGLLTYGPRSYLELADVLRGHGADVPQMVQY